MQKRLLTRKFVKSAFENHEVTEPTEEFTEKAGETRASQIVCRLNGLARVSGSRKNNAVKVYEVWQR